MEQQAANDVKLNSVINQPNHLHRHQTSDPVNSVIHSTLKNKPNFEMKSETNVIYNYNTISNLSIWGCEFAPTVRESMKSWNCSVQFWLANYFYRRCKASRNIRQVIHLGDSFYFLIPYQLRNSIDARVFCISNLFGIFFLMNSLCFANKSYVLLRLNNTV